MGHDERRRHHRGRLSSTCYGDYYAWGETEPRYTSITISGETSVSFGDWKSEHSSGYSSSDYPTYTGATLDAEHDAATQNWGTGWRTPTNADFKALQKACTGTTSFYDPTSVSDNQSITTGGVYWLSATNLTIDGTTYGVKGLLYVDMDDTRKRVFFPVAGYCENMKFNINPYVWYWSSSLITTNTNGVYILSFNPAMVHAIPSAATYRYDGLTVRPVVAE